MRPAQGTVATPSKQSRWIPAFAGMTVKINVRVQPAPTTSRVGFCGRAHARSHEPRHPAPTVSTSSSEPRTDVAASAAWIDAASAALAVVCASAVTLAQ
jgi:hypothetical protein